VNDAQRGNLGSQRSMALNTAWQEAKRAEQRATRASHERKRQRCVFACQTQIHALRDAQPIGMNATALKRRPARKRADRHVKKQGVFSRAPMDRSSGITTSAPW
jgi:hypothetical protein